MTTTAGRRALLLLAAVSVATACAGPGVRTESATPTPTTGPPSTSAPPTTPAPPPATSERPTTSAPPSTTAGTEAPPATAPDGASTSVGDSLYPALGSADLDVAAYDVALDYDPAANELAGTVTMNVAVEHRERQIALDAVGLTIESVTIDGEPADFETTDTELLISPDIPVGPSTLRQPTVVAVTYRDEPGAADATALLPIGWFPTGDGSYVLNQPDGARTWLPSNDHPSDKATWRFSITVPAGTAAIANGAFVGETAGPDGATWTWQQDEPMATYLVQVLTGDYRVLDGGTVRGVPIVNVALASDVERMQPYFDLTDDQLAFFEPLFGPYPLDRYGLAFADSEPGLAMETQGRSLFSRVDFPGGRPGYVEHLLLAHEIAHQWFGNAVTPADWSDIWLNEAFATYAEWMWLDEVGLEALETAAETNLAIRQVPSRPTSEPTPDSLFGFESYAGGAVVVHALRKELGDEAFFDVLRRWVADNDGASRTTDDFIALAEEVGGRPLDQFVADWLDAAALPAEYPG